MPATSAHVPFPSSDIDHSESRPFASASDLDVIAEVTRGNREMFEVIVRRYNQLLYRVGMAYLRDHGHVEDAMQNTYLKAFLHLDRFERGAAFSTWITRIMINECLMTLRRRKTRPEDGVEPLVLETAGLESAFPSPGGSDHHGSGRAAAESINLKEMKVLLEKAVAALPRKYRTVYVLREIQQLSTAETAAALRVSTASVKVDLHRARERLKAELLKSAAGAELFAYPAGYCDPMTTRVMTAVLAVD